MPSAVFLAGLAALLALAAGYLGGHPLALGVVLVVAACYVAGGLELWRYRRGSQALAAALRALDAPPAGLDDWLSRLPGSLRGPVRQRIEGERAALPAPALTPYLVGLLVLLGMLGTLLGMMLTLRGTGLALESATDLEAVRTALAAPVKGLAFAFGTSIAGIAASSMLGLASALCRRERALAVQALDGAIATHLHAHTKAHRRDEALRLLRGQAEAMPGMVAQLQAAMATLAAQAEHTHARQLAQQEAFHARTEAMHAQLAESVGRSLTSSVAEGARAASASLQPVVESTLAALAGRAAALQDDVGQAMQRQLDGMCAGLEASTTRIATLWTDAAARQHEADARMTQALAATLDGFAATFDARAAGMVETVAARFEASAAAAAAASQEAIARQEALATSLAQGQRDALAAAGAATDAQAVALDRLARQLDARSTALVETVCVRMDASTAGAAAMLADATARQAAAGDALAAHYRAAVDAATAAFAAQGTALVERLHASQAELQATLDAQARTHARATIDEVARLLNEAAEAPKSAAAVVAELRASLSESLARDTAMLEERARLLATVETLLGAVNHASAEQRGAVDALIRTSADALERVAARFDAHVEAGSGRLEATADRIAAGAVEVASLGDVLGGVVQEFGEANTRLVERLQALEGALGASLARSDEQLAYYVAQAREVVDLSVLAQKQIIGELQQLAQARAEAEPA